MLSFICKRIFNGKGVNEAASMNTATSSILTMLSLKSYPGVSTAQSQAVKTLGGVIPVRYNDTIGILGLIS